jgi:hypothetical protein
MEKMENSPVIRLLVRFRSLLRPGVFLVLLTGCPASVPEREGNFIRGTITNYDGAKVNGVEIVFHYEKLKAQPKFLVRDGQFMESLPIGSAVAYFKIPEPPKNLSGEKLKEWEAKQADTTKNVAAKYMSYKTSPLKLDVPKKGELKFEWKLDEE